MKVLLSFCCQYKCKCTKLLFLYNNIISVHITMPVHGLFAAEIMTVQLLDFIKYIMT